MAIVGEGEIANVDIAAHFLGQPGAAVLHDVRLNAPDFVQAHHRSHAALKEVDHPSQGDQRPDHAAEVELEGDEVADGHRPGDHFPAAHEENDSEHDADDAVKRGIERSRQFDQ